MKCRSALEEYCLLKRGISTTPINEEQNKEVTNKELHELLVQMKNEHSEHLREQDLLLDIIKNQSKPNFPREFLANLSANALWDGALYIFGKLGKCIKF
ncbi:MAG: hypothetical protein ACI4N3_04390 [Alphaproteobacteria bacterium]